MTATDSHPSCVYYNKNTPRLQYLYAAGAFLFCKNLVNMAFAVGVFGKRSAGAQRWGFYHGFHTEHVYQALREV